MPHRAWLRTLPYCYFNGPAPWQAPESRQHVSRPRRNRCQSESVASARGQSASRTAPYLAGRVVIAATFAGARHDDTSHGSWSGAAPVTQLYPSSFLPHEPPFLRAIPLGI